MVVAPLLLSNITRYHSQLVVVSLVCYRIYSIRRLHHHLAVAEV